VREGNKDSNMRFIELVERAKNKLKNKKKFLE